MDGNYSCMARLAVETDVTTHHVNTHGANLATRVRAFASALSIVRPDQLITHNWGTIEWTLANLANRARHIHMEDGFGLDEAWRPKRRRVWARRLLLQRSEIVVPSTTLRDVAQKRWKIPPSRLHFIPNGIDISRFTPGELRCRRSASPADTLVIGTVAALRPEKQLSRLLRAFALVSRASNCRLVIAGEGPERPGLEALARELKIGDRTRFAGHIVDTAVLYREFDVFALTSDTEQMPYTVLEAMASGCAIVATDVGDVKRMVAEENVPLIVDRNDEQVASALAIAACDRNMMRRIGEANRLKASRDYDQQRMFESFATLYGLTGPAGLSAPGQNS
jgi:glycosyltransferase involved in cell wall biosynthesis